MLLTLENAHYQVARHRFGPFHFSIDAGERVAIIGPSGAGKSTLLRLMSGDCQPDSGKVLWNQQSSADISVQKLASIRAVLPQQQEVAFDLPPRLIVGLGRIAISPDTDLQNIILAAAETARARHLLDERYQTLSGGEKARIQLARIFAQLWESSEGCLLVDEPLSALDPGLQVQILQSLLSFARVRQHAIVAIVHDINQALFGFERLLLVKEHQLMADIPSKEVHIDMLEQLYDTQLLEASTAEGQKIIIPKYAAVR